MPGRIIAKSSIRLLLSISLIILVAGVFSIIVINWQMKTYAREEAKEKALMMLDRNLAIHTYFSHQLKPDLFKKLKPIMADNDFDPVWMSSTYAVRGIDQYYRSIAGRDYYYKECAINARSPENEADKFERAFIEKLNKTPGLTEQADVRVINGKLYFVVLRRGETMEQGCLRCHSTPEAAPANLVARYGADRSFDRFIGEVVSAVSIRIPLGIAYAKVNKLILHLSVFLCMTLLIVLGLAAYLSKHWVFGPLNTIRLNATEISKDPKLLGKQIDLPSSYELLELTKAFNAMSLQLRKERDRLEYHVKERTKDLKQTRDMLQAVLDAAPAGVVVADDTGRILIANAATQCIFGNTVTGNTRGPEGGYPVSGRDNSPIPAGQLPLSLPLAGQTVIDKEISITRSDGKEAVILASATPFRTGEDDTWGSVTVFKDITSRKKSEEKLRRLSQFPEENPNPILRCSTDGVIFYANTPARHWLATLGWLADKPLPASVLAAVAGAREQDHAFETEITSPEGRTMNFFAVQPPGEDYVNLYGLDFTERKKAEEALVASEHRLRWVLQGSGGGAWDWDLTSGEAWWSQEMYELWGVVPGTQMNLSNSLALIHEQDRGRLRKAVEESISRQTDFQCEFRIHHPKHGERWMASLGRPVHDESGLSHRLLGITLDITERKLAQEALQRSNRELEQFAYVASHDLQEPLRAVVGFLQLIQSRYGDQIDEKGRHFIDRSVKAGYRMQRLIRELLTISRINTKGAAFAPTDLNRIVKDVLENLQTIILEKNIDITCATLPNLTIDASQIQSLFQNLVMNAVKYNENPKPIVDIGCRERNSMYHFFVRDNGIGIPSEFHQRIFMLFQRLHTDSEYPGTGLGLALCKEIVERHGGKIWVESQGKDGSCFNFTLHKKGEY
jgi:PAS domain S-box-containing protein